MGVVRRSLAGAAVCALLLGGCGSETTPAVAVPALADRLERVDAAVAADDPDRIRSSVEALIRSTEEAGAAGDLDADQVAAIVESGEALLAELPEEPAPVEPTEPAEPTTPTTPTETSTPVVPEESDDDKEDEKSDENKPGKSKGHDKKDEDD